MFLQLFSLSRVPENLNCWELFSRALCRTNAFISPSQQHKIIEGWATVVLGYRGSVPTAVQALAPLSSVGANS